MKHRRMRKGTLGIVLAVALTALLLVAACAPASSVPTGENVVKIGALPILTGGGGPADQPAFRGFMDYVKYFNEEVF